MLRSCWQARWARWALNTATSSSASCQIAKDSTWTERPAWDGGTRRARPRPDEACRGPWGHACIGRRPNGGPPPPPTSRLLHGGTFQLPAAGQEQSSKSGARGSGEAQVLKVRFRARFNLRRSLKPGKRRQNLHQQTPRHGPIQLTPGGEKKGSRPGRKPP